MYGVLAELLGKSGRKFSEFKGCQESIVGGLQELYETERISKRDESLNLKNFCNRHNLLLETICGILDSKRSNWYSS